MIKNNNDKNIKKEIVLFEKKLNEIKIEKIKNENELKVASNVLLSINRIEKEIEEKKNSIIKPLNEAIKNVRELFSNIENKVFNLKNEIKQKINEYNIFLEEKRQKELKKLEEKVEAGKISLEKAIEKAENMKNTENQIKTENGKINYRVIRKVIIEKPELLPREYLVPDEVKIRKDVLSGKEIPGVKVVEEKILVLNNF